MTDDDLKVLVREERSRLLRYMPLASRKCATGCGRVIEYWGVPGEDEVPDYHWGICDACAEGDVLRGRY